MNNMLILAVAVVVIVILLYFFVFAGNKIQFIKISSPHLLNIAELEVYDDSGNVALGKVVTGSPLGAGSSYGGLVDGGTGLRWNKSHFFHSKTKGGWVMVDLGGEYNVNRIKIFHRSDCCNDRLVNGKVEALNASSTVVWTKDILERGDMYEFDVVV